MTQQMNASVLAAAKSLTIDRKILTDKGRIDDTIVMLNKVREDLREITKTIEALLASFEHK